MRLGDALDEAVKAQEAKVVGHPGSELLWAERTGWAGIAMTGASNSRTLLNRIRDSSLLVNDAGALYAGGTDGHRDSFRIEVFSGETGMKLGELTQDVDARGFAQLGRILALVPGGATTGYARVTRTAGRNPFLTYAVINDGGVNPSASRVPLPPAAFSDRLK